MKREILTTKDGSTTIHIVEWNESYHSRHGAIQEAKHVFIKNGLHLVTRESISILEIGFGTGLNAFITYLEALQLGKYINYVGVEAYPISAQELEEMNYADELNAFADANVYKEMHNSPWQVPTMLSETFTLIKKKMFFQDIQDVESFDIIYFDAFGYDVQPELWSTEIFRAMYKALKPDGILVTYAARGAVKRSMVEVGFKVEKLAGPPGKREMFRALKFN